MHTVFFRLDIDRCPHRIAWPSLYNQMLLNQVINGPMAKILNGSLKPHKFKARNITISDYNNHQEMMIETRTFVTTIVLLLRPVRPGRLSQNFRHCAPFSWQWLRAPITSKTGDITTATSPIELSILALDNNHKVPVLVWRLLAKGVPPVEGSEASVAKGIRCSHPNTFGIPGPARCEACYSELLP